MFKTRSTTPCLGICSTTYGDDVCKGCKRFVHEVISWNKYSSHEKELVNSRLEEFKVLILKERFTIEDPEIFKLYRVFYVFLCFPYCFPRFPRKSRSCCSRPGRATNGNGVFLSVYGRARGSQAPKSHSCWTRWG